MNAAPSETHLRSEQLLTVFEVALTLRLSVRTVRRLIADGTIPVVRIGRLVRITRRGLEALINGGAARGQDCRQIRLRE